VSACRPSAIVLTVRGKGYMLAGDGTAGNGST
jgi:hypothetical protein